MSEYGNQEVQDDNEEVEDEQELDKTISNNKEINLEDFEPINNQNIELDGESFKPSYNIETDIYEYQFEISNNLTIENSYKEFEPIHDEKNVLACNAPDIDNSWIQSIVNDPTLTTNEKIEKLEKSKRKVSKNSELSGIEKKKISSAIDDAITKLSKGFVFTSSIPSNRDATGKNNTSDPKDNQNSTQSEKEDLYHANEDSKEFKEEGKSKNLEKQSEEILNEIEKPKTVEKEYEDIINANELVLLHDNKSNLYRLTEIRNAQIQEYDSTIGLNNFSQRAEKIDVDKLMKLPEDGSINIICKHGEISVSESHSLLSVDNNLNIIEINAKEIKPGTPILIPRILEVKENSAPLDLSNCGEVVKKNNKEYIREARTECNRFIEKNFELGYILGQYCSEGSMNLVTLTSNSDKKVVEKVKNFVEKNFGLNPSLSKYKSKDYKTIYELNCRSKLAKKVFTKGLGLKPKHAPYKEIPPFLYNAPKECVKGFLKSYLKGDGSIGDYRRKNSPKRDVYIRYNTSSRKMAFGLNFLFKRFGIDATVFKREFDNIEHPNWHDNYSLRITGKRNLNILQQNIHNVPEYSKFARDKSPEININPWIKKLDKKMKEQYGISLRMLAEQQKIPHMAAKCAQENNLKNLSEGNLLKTLDYLKKQNYKTPTIEKLQIFENNTFTRVKEIKKNNNQENIYNLSIADNNSYIAGIGHIYIKKN